MNPWLASVWGQLWPNLVANVLWVPVAVVGAWAHHRWSKKHMAILHEHIAALRDRVQDLIESKEEA